MNGVSGHVLYSKGQLMCAQVYGHKSPATTAFPVHSEIHPLREIVMITCERVLLR